MGFAKAEKRESYFLREWTKAGQREGRDVKKYDRKEAKGCTNV
jgi:hypothetical protein